MSPTPTSLAVLGATGGIGRLALDRALQRGHQVRALVRPNSSLEYTHTNLTVVRGDATNVDDVSRLLEGTSAVLSAIGTPPRARTPARTLAAHATIEAMQRTNVHRLVAISVYGVGTTRPHLPFFTRAVVFPLFLRRVIADHVTQERAIEDSAVDWTLLRPPYLTDGPATGTYAFDFGDDIDGLTWTISRADVAHHMLDAVERGTHVRAALGLSYRRDAA
ncbi:MAG: SDR family oxidoreductase [Myxococcota bacterium]